MPGSETRISVAETQISDIRVSLAHIEEKVNSIDDALCGPTGLNHRVRSLEKVRWIWQGITMVIAALAGWMAGSFKMSH